MENRPEKPGERGFPPAVRSMLLALTQIDFRAGLGNLFNGQAFREDLKGFGRWSLITPVVLLILFGFGQLALMRPPVVAASDTGSQMDADYSPWPDTSFAPVLIEIISDIRGDQGDLDTQLVIPGDYWPGQSQARHDPSPPPPKATPVAMQASSTPLPSPTKAPPTAKNTATSVPPTVTPTRTPTPTSTSSPAPTVHQPPTATPTATQRSRSQPTSTPTATQTPVPTATPTQTPTATATQPPPPTSTSTVAPSATPNPPATSTPTSVPPATATNTPAASSTPVGTVYPSFRTPTPTNVDPPTQTNTPAPPPTNTPTPITPVPGDTPTPLPPPPDSVNGRPKDVDNQEIGCGSYALFDRGSQTWVGILVSDPGSDLGAKGNLRYVRLSAPSACGTSIKVRP